MAFEMKPNIEVFESCMKAVSPVAIDDVASDWSSRSTRIENISGELNE